LRNQSPDEGKADRNKHEHRQANPKCGTRLCLITPGNKRHNECDPCNRHHRDEHEHYQERKQEKAVSLCAKFFPWFDNRSAIANDTVNKNETPPRTQPRKQDNEQKHDANQNANARDEDRLRNLADRFVQLMRVFATVRVVEVTGSTSTGTEICKPGSETDYEPFFQIERLKQNFLHQLECFAERLEDFDF